MKRMTGTVTLSLLEEDNRQRILFRLIPLCTREGVTFENAKEAFPDEGSLRIVPDKHEQSTFKERMRSLSGYCAVVVPSDGREQMKIRQNRNYAPQNSELNQFALYSDVVFEFAPNACFEVIPFGQSAADTLTKKVLLQKNKMLYGPVDKEQAEKAEADTIALFGNESFLMHTFQTEALGRRTVCWNPEAVMNWRQRRAEQRRTERSAENAKEDGAPSPEAKAKNTEVSRNEKAHPIQESKTAHKPEKAAHEKKPKAQAEATVLVPEKEEIAANNTAPKVEPANTIPVMPAENESESELLIGEKLTILDSSVSFEQQLSQLAQPISDHANLLTGTASSAKYEEVEEEPEEIAHFNGTPLTVIGEKSAPVISSRNAVPAIVDKQLRQQRETKKAEASGTGLYSTIDNPIELFSDTLDAVCSTAETREAAIRVLSRNRSFCADLMKSIQYNGILRETETAAMEQLDEIEAERLNLLMQLKQAQDNERKYREEVIASAGQKKRAQLVELNHRIEVAENTEKKLNLMNQSLSEKIQSRLNELVRSNVTALGTASETGIAVSPVIGENHPFNDIIDRIRVHMSACGYSISDDEAATMAIIFAVEDQIVLHAQKENEAIRFATELVKCLGLYSSAAICRKEDTLQLLSILKAEEGCTPTVSIQPIDNSIIHAKGHKTLLISTTDEINSALNTYPIILIPELSKKLSTEEEADYSPISFSSFEALIRTAPELSTAGEQWLKHFLSELQLEGIDIPRSIEAKIQRFIAIGCNIMRGSFVSTADCAVAMWLVPYLKGIAISDQIAEQLTGFTRTLKLLQLKI